MVPFLFLIAVILLLRGLGVAGVRPLKSWKTCVRLGLAAMFLFTGLTHFSRMRHDYAAMIPPPLPTSLALVYLTGLAELVFGAGLLFPETRKASAIALMILLVALFPANVSAWLRDVPFGGRPPTPLLPRTLIQAAFLLLLWWSSARGGATEQTGRRGL